MAVRLVIADDHPVVLKGLISFLRDHFDLVASCANGEECLKAIRGIRAGRGPDRHEYADAERACNPQNGDEGNTVHAHRLACGVTQ